jgi:hypothetical protein
VDNIERVEIKEGLRDLSEDGAGVLFGVAFLLQDAVEELGAPGVFEDEHEGGAIFVDPLQLDDVWVFQSLHDFDFSPQAGLVEIFS